MRLWEATDRLALLLNSFPTATFADNREYWFIFQDLDNDAPEPTDWEKYAAEEYEILVAEEGAGQEPEEM